MTEFYKYEGTGNDFILINNLNNQTKLLPKEIEFLCNRHIGIGADGLILLENSEKADCFMNYYNSDGTLAEMCGNGIRCTAKFFLEQTNKNQKELLIDTRSGIKKIICNSDGTFSVDMGIPIFESKNFPKEKISLENFNFNCVSVGNPHAVSLINNLENIDIKNIGPKIENNSIFPNKINVEFVEKINEENYKVKIWERGCGETLSCGTGACAVFSVLDKQTGLTSHKEISLEFMGGKLFLSKNEQGHIILRGPATFVFKGELPLGTPSTK